jgi:tetratricopeptide (TPR) repeat protein
MLSQRTPVHTADVRRTAPVSEARLLVLRDGDTHMRAGRFDQAVTAFDRAVAADSAFALAHFRLAVAALWADQSGSNLNALLERAVAHRNELDEQNRILLDGFVAWRRGEWGLAEHIYRRALTIDTTSTDARHQLGEVLLHYNTPQGRSVGEARAEFERVLMLDPRHYGALWHLAQLAARDGRDPDVVALTTRLLALKPDPVRQLEVEALRAALGDEADLDRVIQRLRDADESLLLGTGWRLAVFARRLDAAGRVFALLADPRRGPYARRLGHTQLFHLAVARGRRGEAAAQLRALTALRDAGAQPEELAVLLAASPNESDDQLPLREGRDAIVRIIASQRDTVHSGGASMRVIESHGTLGRIHALLGDSAQATRVVRELEQGLARVSSDSSTRALAVGQAAAIRALQASRAGRFEDVIRWVDESLHYRWFSDALGHPHLAYSLERFLRAEALLALGRSGEADTWFATIGQHDLSDFIYLRPALLRRAEIAQRHGDTMAANRLRGEARRLFCEGACADARAR